MGGAEGFIPTFTADFTSGTPVAGLTFTRASSATYFDSTGTLQTAGTNVPRYDYDPTTLLLRGLLLEDSRTNFLLNSLTPVTQTTGSLALNTYTLWIVGTGSATVAANTAVGSGFGVATAGSPVTFIITTAGTVDVTVAGSPTRFQLENNSIPSSFIITGGATATRATDNASLLSQTWYNISEGTIFVDTMLMGNATTTQKAFAMTNAAGSENDLLASNYSTVNTNFSVRSGGAAVASFMLAGMPMGFIVNKQAIAYKVNDFAGVQNGVVVGTDVSGAVPAVMLDSVALGKRTVASNSQYLNGWFRKISFYNIRLRNTVMQSLTL